MLSVDLQRVSMQGLLCSKEVSYWIYNLKQTNFLFTRKNLFMKKQIFTFLIIIGCAAMLQAQTDLGTFEDGSLKDWGGGGGASVSITTNPNKAGNISDSVMKVNIPSAWGGNGPQLWEKVDFLTKNAKSITAYVYSPDAGTLQMNIQGSSSGAPNIQVNREVKKETWQVVSFDLTGITAFDYKQLYIQGAMSGDIYYDSLVYNEYGDKPVSSIDIVGMNYVWLDGGTVLNPVVSPDNAIPWVKWSIDNESVATLDTITGLLKAVSEGTVNVTATAKDGSGIKGTIDVEVKAVPTWAKDSLIADFENGVNDFNSWDLVNTTIAIADNPKKNGVNNSDKALKFEYSADAGLRLENANMPYRSYFTSVEFDIYTQASATAMVQIDASALGEEYAQTRTEDLSGGKWETVRADFNYSIDTSYKQIWFRLTSPSGTFYIDNIRYLLFPQTQDSIAIVGKNEISENDGTVQLSTAFYPWNSENRKVAWSFGKGSTLATVSEEGLVSAVAD